MIESLQDAWDWYVSVKKLVDMMERISRLYWDERLEGKTLGDTLYKDDRLRQIEAPEIQKHAKRVRNDLDDLAVLLLFSVFEADVRSRASDELEKEVATPPRHPALRKAYMDAEEAIKYGSFWRLTEAYGESHPDEKELVNQVRRYRNWVAHGRRGAPATNTTPDAAFERLKEFLEILNKADPPTSLTEEDAA